MRFTKQEGIRDCGICCMQNIIRYYGGFLNTEKLRKLTNTDENGTSIYNIIRVSNDIGFESKAYKCDINDLNNLSFPLQVNLLYHNLRPFYKKVLNIHLIFLHYSF